MLAGNVRFQLGLFSKSLPTDFTFTKHAAALHVRVEAFLVVERAFARVTGVGLIAVVQPHVTLQIESLREDSATRFAPVRAVFSMSSLVCSARGGVPENQGALAAAVHHRVGLAVCVGMSVHCGQRGKCACTRGTLVRTLARVRAGMLVQLKRSAEGLVTVFAGVWLATLVSAHVDAHVSGCAKCLGTQGALVFVLVWPQRGNPFHNFQIVRADAFIVITGAVVGTLHSFPKRQC